jgi:hypothetical protein
VPQKGYHLPRYAGSEELRVKSYEFITTYSKLLIPNFGGKTSVGKGEKVR